MPENKKMAYKSHWFLNWRAISHDCRIWTRGTKWIRIKTTLIEDLRVEAKKSMLDNNPMLRKMYSEYDDNTVVFYLSNSLATISAFVEPSRTISF